MAKKSKAQLKRLMQRAEARGETYVPPDEEEKEQNSKKPDTLDRTDETHDSDEPGVGAPEPVARTNKQDGGEGKDSSRKEDKVKLTAAIQLQKDLASIEASEELKAKERRSAKRKAEAIAIESSGCASAEELLQWYEANGNDHHHPRQTESNNKNEKDGKRSNPYIVFIGQLAFDTTKEQLFSHIQKQLRDDQHNVTTDNVKIRLLTDPKTKKSRGMAFVEVHDDPELLYSCLKLHHTHLNGRRINVERSAGGGKNSETRKNKLKQFREEQIKYMEETVNAVLEEYYQRGEIQRQGEIDEGVVLLCKRHSATVVQAALERYVETNGADMDNPSAYLTFLVGKLAEEGIYKDREKEKNSSKTQQRKKNRGTSSRGTTPAPRESKRPRKQPTKFADSEFAKQGVDMEATQGTSNPEQIFPSLARRGRGRGYM